MFEDIYEMETEPNRPEILDFIPDGIAIIDVDGKKVGTVKHYQAPSATAFPDLRDFPPMLRTASMPDELVFHMLKAGFMAVNTGFFSKDRFVLLHQIDYVTDDEVFLDTSGDDLLKA